jgi:hypothetical protein
MDCFVGILIALMGVNTANLTQLALTFPSQGSVTLPSDATVF